MVQTTSTNKDAISKLNHKSTSWLFLKCLLSVNTMWLHHKRLPYSHKNNAQEYQTEIKSIKVLFLWKYFKQLWKMIEKTVYEENVIK